MSRRHTRDVDREDALRRHGLEVVRVTSLALRDHTAVSERLLAGRRRARFLRPQERTWYAEPPADTLDEQLRDAEAQTDWREQLLNQALPTAEEVRSW